MPKQTKPPHQPTDANRKTVDMMIAVGIPQEDVAAVIGIDAKTLRKHYREELDTAASKANTKVAGQLFKNAMGGDTTAAIWWTKARMGWAEKKNLSVSFEDMLSEALGEAGDSEGDT